MPDTPGFSLAGKVIVQFGATGLLGRALIQSLLGARATLVLASRDRPALEQSLGANAGADANLSVEAVDISSEAALHALRDRLLSRWQRVDGIVFNAVTRPMERFDDDLAKWRESMEVNATGFFSTVRTFGDVMAARGAGSIVNIASQMGVIGVNPWLYGGDSMNTPPDYFFHKGGMINLTRYLASHYGPNGVRVNTVSPGGIFHPDRPPPADFLERYAAATMLGRMARAAEIGGAVTFLLSDAATYVTGANLPVDGGYTAK